MVNACVSLSHVLKYRLWKSQSISYALCDLLQQILTNKYTLTMHILNNNTPYNLPAAEKENKSLARRANKIS